eukprot:CAMPEP_0197832274 /NCGR_PEP_ID=MMETSP1437-20131217/13998_1 /TAXON_ID=49252 ORGANISM="Eucampia antarctica, Strain CCMP1452" /NCGR_SAMPLE_ID=MMETSP1437 /ASSEMBLY_ACC=CAM_ASM_001096 /LENGTH=227 /DNA_ID=CAMNT_0043435561 /DNA_START=118 /DNA_END=801 /DNA_ORIENTATION=+
MLAKYDHASQYEAHSDASGVLYGGKDKGYAEAVGIVITNDPPSAGINEGTIGGFKVVQSEAHQVVYGSDSAGLCLAVVTGLSYPSRIAVQMLTELYGQYMDTLGLQVKSATTNSLSKKSKTVLSTICTKYDDLSNVDKASSLTAKVDEVKVHMQDNISTMLTNIDKAEHISDQANQLNEQANVFKKKSTDLKKQMRCKDMKMTIILVFLVLAILASILIPLILKATK